MNQGVLMYVFDNGLHLKFSFKTLDGCTAKLPTVSLNCVKPL